MIKMHKSMLILHKIMLKIQKKYFKAYQSILQGHIIIIISFKQPYSILFRNKSETDIYLNIKNLYYILNI